MCGVCEVRSSTDGGYDVVSYYGRTYHVKPGFGQATIACLMLDILVPDEWLA